MLFGIFFPAVTGFTVGVNMSGDLRDPKKAIPRGTMSSILVGLVVYMGLAWFLHAKVDATWLQGDKAILEKVALFGPAVVAGIWGATLSSALGSIMGAPRILPAVSGDGLTPRWFAKGHGAGNEPRRALIVAFAIAQCGIIIAELDAIARIVSIIFLASYGFLNIVCAIESIVSPDFRPQFKIPVGVSIVGAATCVLLMILFDPWAMLGSTVFMSGLFLWLSRKHLKLDAGDAWEGVWSSLVRTFLWRLSRLELQQRNWRPNILSFRPPADELRDRLRSVAAVFIAGKGVMTDIEIAGDNVRAGVEGADPDVGVFTQRVLSLDPYETISDVCRYHGFAGMTPNTVLLDWGSFRKDLEKRGELFDAITGLDHNLLIHAVGDADVEEGGTVDVWWSQGAGNIALSTALGRFLVEAKELMKCEVRFLLLSNEQLDERSAAQHVAAPCSTRRACRQPFAS